jgi:hypothetical protein
LLLGVPGLLVIGAGLALLATEFLIVRSQLRWAVTIATAVRTRLMG